MAISNIQNVADNPKVAAERAKLFELQSKKDALQAEIENADSADDVRPSAFELAAGLRLPQSPGCRAWRSRRAATMA